MCLLLANLHPAFGQFETASVLGYVHGCIRRVGPWR
jgi:hypothetical protein